MPDYRTLGSICIVFLHGIGDLVMFTPSVRKIRAINPSLRIAVVLREELGLRALAENTGLFDEVLEISLKSHPRFYVPWTFWTSEYWAIRKKLDGALRGRDYDMVEIVYGQLVPTAVHKVLRPRRSRMHRVEALAAELGVPLTRQEKNSPVVRIPGAVKEEVSGMLLKQVPAGAVLIGIQRNTLDRTRFIDLGETRQFIDWLNRIREGLFFMIFADELSYRLEEETDRGHLSAPNLRYSFEVAGGPGDALRLAALVDACDFVVGVDSAVFNIACALGKNTIGVFNTYKVRSGQRALEGDNIICIDSPHASAEDLLGKFRLLESLAK